MGSPFFPQFLQNRAEDAYGALAEIVRRARLGPYGGVGGVKIPEVAQPVAGQAPSLTAPSPATSLQPLVSHTPPSKTEPLRDVAARLGYSPEPSDGRSGEDWLSSEGAEKLFARNASRIGAELPYASQVVTDVGFDTGEGPFMPGSERVLGGVAPGSFVDVPYDVGVARQAERTAAELRAMRLAELQDAAKMSRARFESQMPIEVGEQFVRSQGLIGAARERAEGLRAQQESRLPYIRGVMGLFQGLTTEYNAAIEKLEADPVFQSKDPATKALLRKTVDDDYADRRRALSLAVAAAAGSVPNQAFREPNPLLEGLEGLNLGTQ